MDSLVISDLVPRQIQNVSALDKAVARVKRHTVTSIKHIYAIGAELRKIRDEDLWMLRMDKKTGKPKYRCFWDWCSAEIPISESYCRRLMQVNENFSLEEMRKHGVTRLSVAMRLPRKKRKAYLRRAARVPACGKEVRQIARDMLAETDQRDYTDLCRRVDVSLPLGISVLPMWCRLRNQGPVGKPTQPACHLTDDPWTKMRLAKDVVLYVRLSRNPRGELIAILEVREGKKIFEAQDDIIAGYDGVVGE